MPKKWTHTQAFEYFGTKPRNVMWSWSARSEDGNIVVGTFWQDHFERRGGELVYDRPGSDVIPMKSPGWPEWKENLAWAKDRCGGCIRAIIAIAEDKSANPRKIKECFPHPKKIMNVTQLDRDTGAFTAVAEYIGHASRS